MRILVLGSSGQLGSEIMDVSQKFDSLSWIFSNRQTLDLSKTSRIFSYLDTQKPTIVINCAAFSNVDESETNFELANKINYNAVDRISKWTSINKKKLIHLSTDYVFNGLSDVPYTESSKTDPINKYGISKLSGEIACLNNDVNSILIRTSWLYSNFGNNFLKTIINLMNNNDHVNVVNDQTGSPTSASDLANTILKIVMSETWFPGVYHFSNSGSTTWYDFARLVKDLTKIKSKIKPTTSKKFNSIARRPKYSILNNSKIKNTYKLEIPFYDESLKRCLKKLKY